MIETEFGHSISFIAQDGTTKNTWDDWGLIADSRPTLSTPPPKTNILDDVKMINGNIDLTNSMTPYTLYGNREGTFTFIYNPIFQSLNGKNFNWIDLYGQIMRFVHGKKLQMVLEDDDEYYYEGRFHVENWTSNNDGSGSTVTIGYSVYPYKRKEQLIELTVSKENMPGKSSITSSTDGWSQKIDLSNYGSEPVIPIIYWKPIVNYTEDTDKVGQQRQNRCIIFEYINENLGIDYSISEIHYKRFDPFPDNYNFINDGSKKNTTSNNVISLLDPGETEDGFYIFKDLDMIFYSPISAGENTIRFIGHGNIKIEFLEGKL